MHKSKQRLRLTSLSTKKPKGTYITSLNSKNKITHSNKREIWTLKTILPKLLKLLSTSLNSKMTLVSRTPFKIKIIPYSSRTIHQVSCTLTPVAKDSMPVSSLHRGVSDKEIFLILPIETHRHILKIPKTSPNICSGLKRIYKKTRKISLKTLGITMILILMTTKKEYPNSAQRDTKIHKSKFSPVMGQ